MHRIVLAALLALAAAPSPATAQEDVAASPTCRHCGMDRARFATSRMVVEYDDGSRVGTCSIHCAAIDNATTLDKAPRSFKVADMGTKALVDAEQATWVIVASKPGVMTRRAKWAFADRATADAFASAQGGTLATFEEAMRATYEDLYLDTRMIREKRRAMRQRAMEHPAAPPPAGKAP